MNQITPEWIAQQRAICDAATPGPWEADEYGDMVWAKNPYGHDLMRVADIRGWGHLTGSGACALPQTQAQGIQNANQVFIAAARTALPAALDEIERLAADNRKLREAHELAQSGYGTYAHTGNENAPSGTESEAEHAE